jgi:hypothetical protein
MMAQKSYEEYKLRSAAERGELYEEKPAEVVDIVEVWRSMQKSSEAWALMMDMDPKLSIIAKQIDDFRQEGIRIEKSPLHYLEVIDSMSAQNPVMLKNSFKDVMMVVAIVEYDFDNGINKDILAYKILGSQEAVEQNKKRLGIE